MEALPYQRFQYSKVRKIHVSTEHLKFSPTPSNLFSDSRKYSQARRVFSTKNKNYFLNSHNYDRGISSEIKKSSKSPIDLLSFFSVSRNQTPTIFKPSSNLNKLELARSGLIKNKKKLEEVKSKLEKLSSLFGRSSFDL
jgi:hypothetical protein